MRIAICDDERALSTLLGQLIERWGGIYHHLCLVQAFTSGEELLF